MDGGDDEFEVEQKFRTDGHAEIAAQLVALGAAAGVPVAQEDSYLAHPSRDFAQTNEALRLRRVGVLNAITYKGPKRPGPTKTREEVEIACAEGPAALSDLKRLFEALGFRPVFVVKKTRTPYHLKRDGRPIEVVLDDVEGLGTFVEVETIAADEADLAAAQNAVTLLAERLGLRTVEPRSYLRMLLERLDDLRSGANPPVQT